MPQHRSVDDLIEELLRQISEFREKKAAETPGADPADFKSRLFTVCVDSSEYSERAVAWLAKHLDLTPNDVVVLTTIWERATLEHLLLMQSHATYPTFAVWPDSNLSGLTHERVKQQNEAVVDKCNQLVSKLAQEYVKATDEKLKNLKGGISDAELKEHHPKLFKLLLPLENSTSAHQIGALVCEAGERLKSDLLVVGCRGLGSFRRFFLGSVSKFVVEHAKLPVMVVKD
uniref:UspA domain-containing protein n=1 Tax=Chromera velia CCMP2878 TaxID=1169474 RepID=A0A0G4FAX1_9ALVE|mmetsp:Transcript_11971/g.22996  ORF Transcript_11971/g.22996 Transcript_11971/m.22996 type:complete len:230 (+) Transcript_11971:212-901(+)|eukprot:Cvel_15965.t1-p1 / transcript=Cvel_15965.t1 / gene=Cvel_15965 / organism=Chromera_velia_CCMP2878 / gene_product=Universal stress protein A-like protein, putative / transcript_product=Universal stress protein A-like protein, putative / location=Cvel_scaffold1208:8708-10287(-) / protein_length=229 / sequence_SO=supercontig / SO=protein_coding / is_pseudo=false